MNTIQINFQPIVSSNIIHSNPPFIAIIDEHPHAERLTVANIISYMLCPRTTQGIERQQLFLTIYLWFLSTENIPQITMDTSLIRAMVNTPNIDINSLMNIINKKSQEAHIAGSTIFFIHNLHKAFTQQQTSQKPSLSKALFFARTTIKKEQRYKREQNKKLPTSKDQLERYWYAYKAASHLWLSAWLLQEDLREAGDPRINSNSPLFHLLTDPSLFIKFFKIAEFYRCFGEAFALDNTGPIFGPNEAWRPTPNLDLDGITVTHENKIYAGLQDLLESWKKRGKWQLPQGPCGSRTGLAVNFQPRTSVFSLGQPNDWRLSHVTRSHRYRLPCRL